MWTKADISTLEVGQIVLNEDSYGDDQVYIVLSPPEPHNDDFCGSHYCRMINIETGEVVKANNGPYGMDLYYVKRQFQTYNDTDMNLWNWIKKNWSEDHG